jgi:hypothetical protein
VGDATTEPDPELEPSVAKSVSVSVSVSVGVDGGGEEHEPERSGEDVDNVESWLGSALATIKQGERVLLAIQQSLVELNADGRKDELTRACLEVREQSARVVITLLECAQWAAVANDPSMYVRFHVSVMRPIQVRTAQSVQPALSGLYMRVLPLQLACAVGSALGLVAALVLFFGVPLWWLAVFATVSWPSVIFLTACLNRTLLWNLVTSFQPLFVSCLNLVVMGTLCALWRHQPAKLAALSAFLPSMVLAGFTDALPEAFRVRVSRVFFTLNVVGLLALLAGIAFNRLELEDFEVNLLSIRVVKISSVVASSLTSLLPFALRNLGMIIWRPGVLPIIQSSVASVKLSSSALLVAKAMHTFSVLQVAHTNETMAKAMRSMSMKSSRHFSMLVRDAQHEEDEDQESGQVLTGRAARFAAFDIPVPAISEVPLQTLVETLVKILRAMDAEFSSVSSALLSIPGIECLGFRHVVEQMRRCGDSSAKLAALGMDIVTLTTFAVGPADLCRCLVSSRRPVEVWTKDSLIPVVSRVFVKSKLLQVPMNVMWGLGAIPLYLVIYDVRPDYQWWLAMLPLCTLPGVVCFVSCLNRKIVTRLATTFQATSSPPFQPVYILFWILVMYSCLAALWRNHPAKTVALAFVLPQCVLASFVDAYPEAGRKLTSRYCGSRV